MNGTIAVANLDARPECEPARPKARDFFQAWMKDRELNRAFYRQMPPDKLDQRVVDAKTRRSDSPRDSLLYLMYVTRNYAYSVKQGVMHWGPERESLLMAPALQTYDKKRLLVEWERVEQELLQVLRDPGIETRLVRVSWSEEPMPALEVLEGLLNHEMLAAGWNRALARQLGMETGLRAVG